MKTEEKETDQQRVIAYLRTVSVRNIPPGVSKERMKGIFERFGRVETVVLSSLSSGCVVFKNIDAAEKAVNAVNFSGTPFLIDGERIHVFMWSEVGLDPLDTLFDTLDAETSVYVTNISGTTTPQALKSYFSVFGGIKYQPKIEGLNDRTRFAYIIYQHKVHRDMALQAHGKVLDGNTLGVKPCYRYSKRQ